MAFELIECLDDTAWDEFVRDSFQGNVFCLTDFLRSLDEPFVRYLVKEEGAPVAGTILMTRDGLPLRAPHGCAEYQGIMFGRAVEALPTHRRVLTKLKTVDYLLGELADRYRYLSFGLHHEFTDLRSFQWFNYHEPEKGRFAIELRYTGLLDLRTMVPQEQYLQGVRELRRREYNRAVKEGVTVEGSNNIGLLDRLHEMTFDRQALSRPVDEARQLRLVGQGALDANFGKLLLARSAAGEVASAYLFLFDNRCAYYLFGGNHPDLRKTGASTYLMFYAIDLFKKQGMHYFDFVGVNSPNRGDFKTSFNAEPKLYYVVSWERPD
jgi:Acetyltransferase (GNAT) domain